MLRTAHLDAETTHDPALVQHARDGSAAAFSGLVHRHADAVYNIALNMASTPRDAERVVQDAFLAAWRELGSLPAGERFTTWLYGLAMRTPLLRRQRDRRAPSCSLESFLPAFDRSGRLVAGKGRWLDTERSHAPTKTTGVLREALECIEDPIRAAFVLRDLLGLSDQEAALVLCTTPKALRRDAHRARLLLHGFIERL
jgi:RNA polymerase sigma-70 factor (ECF subfamily)